MGSLDLSQAAIIIREDEGSWPIGWNVRIISKRRLREFWKSRKHDSGVAERDLAVWYKLANSANWTNFAALKQTLGSSDQVGNCVVFDVGRNRFRLIGRVNYAKGIVYVLRVMDHADYDKKYWIEDCGCHKPPPKRAASAKKATATRNPAKGRRKRKR
jgi:mRNA interferase HigB